MDEGGSAAIQAKYKFQSGSATTSIDPVSDGITLTMTGAGADVVWSVGPFDPGWVVAGNVATWTEPGSGAWRVSVDTAKRTVRLDATGLTLDAPLAQNPVRVTLRSGGSYGAREAAWRGTSSGKYKYP